MFINAAPLDNIFAALGATCRILREHRTPKGVPTPQRLVGYKHVTPTE